MTPTTPVIDSFRGKHAFLSNFYPATIYMDGLPYKTLEHAYQASKSSDLKVRELIRNAKTPYVAKKLGYAVQLPADWEEKKNDVMLELVRKKFENVFLLPLLLETGDAELIEGNNWNDTWWGICKGKGENHLGKILMRVRDERREFLEELADEAIQPTKEEQ